jgi:hypothetical protein
LVTTNTQVHQPLVKTLKYKQFHHTSTQALLGELNKID